MIPLDEIAAALGIEGGFVEDPGLRAVQFMYGLPAVTGRAARAREPVQYMQWQVDLTRQIYGTLDENGERQYRTVYVEIPRKNGKSTWSAMNVLYALLCEQEPTGELYSIAHDIEQAKIVYRAASAMVKRVPDFEKWIRVRDYYSTLEHYDSGAAYRALPASKAGGYGYNPNLVIFDELHVQKTRELWDVMKTSQGARENPLMIAITTAGWDKTSICWEVHEYAVAVANGEVEDPTFLPVIFSAHHEDDWSDPETWRKANPSLGVTLQEDWLAKEVAQAQRVPAQQNTVKREHLNIWTSQQTRWIDTNEWDACGVELDPADFEKEKCVGGIDLASRFDLAAHVRIFNVGGKRIVLPTFWMPLDVVEQKTREAGVPYQTWVDQGYIIPTAGNVTDFDEIEKDILDFAAETPYIDIGADPWNAEATMQHLTAQGLTVTPVPQTVRNLTAASVELEALILSRNLVHPRNPVLDWCVANVEVYRDNNGNIRPIRPQQDLRLKVDGVIALVIALARALVAEEQRSMYEDEEFEPVFVEVVG